MKKCALVYIVYGDDIAYYEGAKFSLLSFLSHIEEEAWPSIYVLTEKPEQFAYTPATVFAIDSEQKKEWTKNGRYHFRIKNRGLKFILEQAAEEVEKFLFFDADTHFTSSAMPLFELVNEDKSVLFYPEKNLYSDQVGVDYEQLRGRTFVLPGGDEYRLTENSVMWNSGVIGVNRHRKDSVDYADEIILSLMSANCQAHTIEQFALSEALSRDSQLSPAREFVRDYSTSGQKNWARKVLKTFFQEHGDKPFEEQVKLAQSVSFTRPLSEVIRGHVYKKKKKLRKLFGLKEE